MEGEDIAGIISDTIENPAFARYGLLGLFLNGLFSMFIPFPPEVTAVVLMLAGEPQANIVVVLSVGWIIGSVLVYYAGASGSILFRKWVVGSQKGSSSKDRRGGGDNKQGDRGKWRRLIEKYGWSIIFVSPWIPIIGDFIPAIAGIKKYNICIFMLSISAGKIVKAVAVVLLGSVVVPSL